MSETFLMFVLVYKYSEFLCKYPIGKKQSPYILSLHIFGLTLRCVCVCVCVCVCKTSRPALGLGLPFIVYLGSLPEVNLPGREVNHSPSSSTEVKNAAPMCLHGVERKNLTYK